jgi:hypothetical protein
MAKEIMCRGNSSIVATKNHDAMHIDSERRGWTMTRRPEEIVIVFGRLEFGRRVSK